MEKRDQIIEITDDMSIFEAVDLLSDCQAYLKKRYNKKTGQNFCLGHELGYMIARYYVGMIGYYLFGPMGDYQRSEILTQIRKELIDGQCDKSLENGMSWMAHIDIFEGDIMMGVKNAE